MESSMYNGEGLNFQLDLTKIEYGFLNYLFESIQGECRELFKKKNEMYEASFFKQCEEDTVAGNNGLCSAVIRLKDKVNRISALVKNPEKDTLTDESIKDTLKDLSNYALMCLVYLEVKDRDKADEVNIENADKL